MNSRVLTAAVIVIILAALAYIVVTNRQSATESGTPAGKMSPNAMDGQRDPMMTGEWKSTDDAKFTRTFAADGSVVDAYAGDASATDTGTWSVVDPTIEVTGVSAEALAGMTIIRINFEKSGAMLFGIKSLSETSLAMVYLDRGNILSFTKVQ
jgi:hypothetical protein